MNIKADILKRIIESTVSELEDNADQYLDYPLLNKYNSIMIQYYRLNLTNLEQIINELEDKSVQNQIDYYESELIIHIAKLRLSIRKSTVRKYLVTNLIEIIEKSPDNIVQLWSGEVYILIGFALGEINEFQDSISYYEKSLYYLQKLKAKKKILRAQQNIIATYESLKMNDHLLFQYKELFHNAYELRAYGTMALALMNIARGFQKLKLYSQSLKYIHRAFSLIRRDPFTVQYYLVHLNRAHILIDTNQIEEAKRMIEICRLSPFVEIQGGVALLDGIIQKKAPSALTIKKGQRLLFGWMDRLKLSFHKKPEDQFKIFSQLEESLLCCICLKKITLEDAAKQLYGNSIEREFTIDRVKNLIKRINKKIPAKIIRENNILRITEY